VEEGQGRAGHRCRRERSSIVVRSSAPIPGAICTNHFTLCGHPMPLQREVTQPAGQPPQPPTPGQQHLAPPAPRPLPLHAGNDGLAPLLRVADPDPRVVRRVRRRFSAGLAVEGQRREHDGQTEVAFGSVVIAGMFSSFAIGHTPTLNADAARFDCPTVGGRCAANDESVMAGPASTAGRLCFCPSEARGRPREAPLGVGNRSFTRTGFLTVSAANGHLICEKRFRVQGWVRRQMFEGVQNPARASLISEPSGVVDLAGRVIAADPAPRDLQSIRRRSCFWKTVVMD